MANFLDKTGLQSVLTAISDKISKVQAGASVDLSAYAKKSELPKSWTGTQAQYDALASKDESTTYYII